MTKVDAKESMYKKLTI